MPSKAHESRTSVGVVPWLVGLFALWQLAFMPLANLLEFVPIRPGKYDVDPPIETSQRWGRFTSFEPLQHAVEIPAWLLASWGELTGQEQGWNMFTPAFPPYTVVPVVEFRFPDGATDRVSSRFDPPNLTHPRPRTPLINDREFNLEANVVMLAWHCHPQSLAEQPALWRQLPERVRENEDLLTRWLSWQTRRYRTSHPDSPDPIEVVLILRYVPTPQPGEPHEWHPNATFERPLARWLPTISPEPGYLALEGYDPVAKRYVRLRSWGQP